MFAGGVALGLSVSSCSRGSLLSSPPAFWFSFFATFHQLLRFFFFFEGREKSVSTSSTSRASNVVSYSSHYIAQLYKYTMFWNVNEGVSRIDLNRSVLDPIHNGEAIGTVSLLLCLPCCSLPWHLQYTAVLVLPPRIATICLNVHLS